MLNFPAAVEWYKKAAKLEDENPGADVPVIGGMNEEGSTFKVPLTTIRELLPHNNAERLEIAVVYGFQIITQKGRYKVGDEVIYVPIDSILPQWLEDKIFPPDSKIKLHKHRIRQIKLRGVASQGMLIDPSECLSPAMKAGNDVEYDYATILGITKYTPPPPKYQTIGVPKNRGKKKDNSHFRKFNGIDNFKWYPDLFKETDEVVVQCKIHGSHLRFCKAPFEATTLLKKLKKWLGFAPSYESLYGSNNVQITGHFTYTGFYGEDVYGKVLDKYDAFSKIRDGEFVHAEIYGDGIQKNYSYGCTNGEHRLIIFDVRVMNPDGTQKWLNPEEVEAYAKERGFEMVPVLYRGPFVKDHVYGLSKGPSVLCPSQPVREGIVVKDRYNYDNAQNKKALKILNEDYLSDKDNTDFQ